MLNKWNETELQHLDTDEKPGEWGQPVKVPEHLQKLAVDKQQTAKLNVIASDLMSLNRSLHDVRSYECQQFNYPQKLPNTTVIIIFHNEEWSILLRTIWSVINRSPKQLLHEIILVDDFSQMIHLGLQLEQYIRTLPVTVSLYRTNNRVGIVGARLLGAKHATGAVLTFLDAQCECTHGWLPPLLARIATNRTNVVCPAIDYIDYNLFYYRVENSRTWGGFNWHINFRWFESNSERNQRLNISTVNVTEPHPTPAMSGGLFAIDRQYFIDLGGYDDQMTIWGRENIELSLRIWTCGGRLEIVPCSHVGHIYKSGAHFTFPGGLERVVFFNSARLVDVWLDQWRAFYYAANPNSHNYPSGDLSARQLLRKQLKCKSFRWYLRNIYPETNLPLHYLYLGAIQSVYNGNCLDTLANDVQQTIGLRPCHNYGATQLFLYTKRKELIHSHMCLHVYQSNGPVVIAMCYLYGRNQKWTYKHQQIINMDTGSCLQVPKNLNDMVLVEPCRINDTTQQWLMETPFQWQIS